MSNFFEYVRSIWKRVLVDHAKCGGTIQICGAVYMTLQTLTVSAVVSAYCGMNFLPS